MVSSPCVDVHGELRRRVTKQRLRLFHVGASFDDEGRVRHAASVEVDLPESFNPLRDPSSCEIEVKRSRGVGRHFEKRLVRALPRRRREKCIEKLRRKRLKTFLPVLRPFGVKPKASPFGVKVPHRELRELSPSKPSAEGDLVEESPIRRRDRKKATNLLERQRASFLPNGPVDSRKLPKRVHLEKLPLNAPATKRADRFRVGRDGLPCVVFVLEATKDGFDVGEP